MLNASDEEGADELGGGRDARQRLNAVGREVSDVASRATSVVADAGRGPDAETDADVEAEVRTAIAALESIADALE